MHELSIAKALLDLLDGYVQSGSKLQKAVVHAGPLKAIEPASMDLAWTAATMGTGYEGAELELTNLPWSLRCSRCEHEWHTENHDVPCPACGGGGRIVGGDEIKLMSIEVQDT